MKKLIIFITATTVFCFCAVLIQAQNNTMINSIKQLERSDANCTLFLNQVLNTNKNLDMFENEVEHFLETSSFWETCFVDQLKNYQDIIINYTGYTKFVPTKKELKYLIKSAVKFKEEFKDYIKEHEPKKSFLYHANKYIFLQTDKSLSSNMKVQRYLAKENKKFNNDLRMGKIIINIKTVQNYENIGGILIEAQNRS